MGRTCSICEAETRPAIEEALAAGEALRAISERFGTSKSALARHRGHLDQGEDGAELIEEVAGEVAAEEAPAESGPQEQERPPDAYEERLWAIQDHLDKLRALSREEAPGLRAAIGRLCDEERAVQEEEGRLAREAEQLAQELKRLETIEVALVARGQDTTSVKAEIEAARRELIQVRAEQAILQESGKIPMIQDKRWKIERQLSYLEAAPGGFLTEQLQAISEQLQAEQKSRRALQLRAAHSMGYRNGPFEEWELEGLNPRGRAGYLLSLADEIDRGADAIDGFKWIAEKVEALRKRS